VGELLDLTKAQARAALGVPTVMGWVKEENTASRRVFERAGFRLAERAERGGAPCRRYVWP
jgi:RimJ/RimL family protein N-acetyltransferase